MLIIFAGYECTFIVLLYDNFIDDVRIQKLTTVNGVNLIERITFIIGRGYFDNG